MQTATNPETGERVVLENGQWVPLKTATNPQTGEQVGFVGGEWVPISGSKQAEKQEEKKPYEGTYGPLFDGIVEGIASTGSGVVGGLGGIVGGLYDAVTGEDYETARETQDKVSEFLTYQPRSDGGRAAVENIAEAFDQPVFNWLNETSESWGQNTNDYLEETPLAPLAPAAGILASLGPEVAAGAVTGGGGTAALRVAKSAGGEIVDGSQAALQVRKARKDEERRVQNRNDKIAPTLLSEIEAETNTGDKSAGAAQVERARQNVATAQNLPTPIALTQGQATRNAAQMTDEYNLPRQDPETGRPLAQHKAQQQRDLHQNLAQQESPRANWMHLNSDEDLGRGVKGFLATREKANKEKTDGLYEIAREQGAMDVPIRVDGLDDAFKELEAGFYNKVQSGDFKMLKDMADEIGVSGGRLATINDVEKFRIQINRVLKDPLNPNHKAMAKILKKAVDKSLDNVPKSAAAYKRARAAYARNKKETDGNALVTQITGKKGRTDSPATANDKVYTKIKNAPIEDVKRMLRMVAKVPEGVNMIHTLGQRVMMDLVETSQKGGGEFNAQAFKRELDKLDRSGKLEALYGPQKAQQLRDIAEVGENVNTLPYGNAANISQSGNTQIKAIMDVLGRAPGVVGRAARGIGDIDQGKAAQLLNEQKVKKALDIEGLLSYE
jgi:hypothetical protein